MRICQNQTDSTNPVKILKFCKLIYYFTKKEKNAYRKFKSI